MVQTTVGRVINQAKGQIVLKHDDLVYLLKLSSEAENGVFMGISNDGNSFYAYMSKPKTEVIQSAPMDKKDIEEETRLNQDKKEIKALRRLAVIEEANAEEAFRDSK